MTRQQRTVSTRAAICVMEGIWELSDNEAAEILGVTADEIRVWRAQPDADSITDERLERVSYVLGIHRALDTLVPDRAAHPGFVRRGAPALDGESPIDVMRQGPAVLRRIRR